MNNDTMKEKIEKELALVKKELESLGRINPDNPADWEPLPPKNDVLRADPNEVADQIEDYEDNTGILKELEIRYNELQVAQRKLEEGAFGKCEVCGEAIEEERLSANSGATTCMKHMQ